MDAGSEGGSDLDVAVKLAVKFVQQLRTRSAHADGREEVLTPFWVEDVEKLKVVEEDGSDVLLPELGILEISLEVPSGVRWLLIGQAAVQSRVKPSFKPSDVLHRTRRGTAQRRR